MNGEHLSDEQLGIGRHRCTPEERERLEAASAEYVAMLAIRFGLPPSMFPADGPFFPRPVGLMHKTPAPDPDLLPQDTPPHI